MSDHPKYQIAVTGSNGQLGKELAALCSLFPDYQFIFLTRDDFSLEDSNSIQSWINSHKIDVFINCAAYTAVDKAESEKEKAYQINAYAPGQIATLLEKKNVPLIHISTDYVFDGNSGLPLRETAKTAPVNLYGASKLEGEFRVLNNNPSSLVLRTSWLYSAFGNNFVKTMIRLMRERKSIQVVADQKGSPTYAGDLAEAILQIILSGKKMQGIYHYSNEGETTWYDFASEIKKLTGSPCEVFPITSSEYATPAKRPSFSLMDKAKIKMDYGLFIPDWQSSLAKCIELLGVQKV